MWGLLDQPALHPSSIKLQQLVPQPWQITDRSKDVIKSGGEWISSIEIENIAVGHPDVAGGQTGCMRVAPRPPAVLPCLHGAPPLHSFLP